MGYPRRPWNGTVPWRHPRMGRKAIPVFYPRILSRRLGWVRGGRLVSNCVVIGYLSMDSRVTLGWALTLEYEPSVVLVRGLVHVRVKVGPPEALRYRGKIEPPRGFDQVKVEVHGAVLGDARLWRIVRHTSRADPEHDLWCGCGAIGCQ